MTYRILKGAAFPPGLIVAKFSVIKYVKKTRIAYQKEGMFIIQGLTKEWDMHRLCLSKLCWKNTLSSSFFFFFFFFFFCLFIFSVPHLQHMEVPRLGVDWSCRCWPTPEPQKCGIQATSATYATAFGNARSLTHWARPGIEPATSWFPVVFV